MRGTSEPQAGFYQTFRIEAPLFRLKFSLLAGTLVTPCPVDELSKNVSSPWVLIFTVGVECGENRGRTGGEPGANPGENRGRPKEPGEKRGHLGREPGENRGLLVFIYKEYRGRRGGFVGRTGGGEIFFETRDPTRDLKINEQDRP